MERSVQKLVKGVSTRLFRMVICISRAIRKCYLKVISELYAYSNDLRPSWTGCSEQSSGSGFDTEGCERVVLLDLFRR